MQSWFCILKYIPIEIWNTENIINKFRILFTDFMLKYAFYSLEKNLIIYAFYIEFNLFFLQSWIIYWIVLFITFFVQK